MRTVLPALEASSECYPDIAHGHGLVMDPHDSVKALNWVGQSWSFGYSREVTES